MSRKRVHGIDQKGMQEMAEPLEQVLVQAKEGNKLALEQVIGLIQERIYNLALRMLANPSEAEDATQEILIKVITHLGTYRGESAFTTWVHRIAVNHLLTLTRQADRHLTFTQLGQQLETSLTLSSPDVAEEVVDELLVEEVRRSCTLGMLLCLGREQRIVIILGELFGVTSEEGGAILAITPETFRKRLSRARTELVAFVAQRCGIVNPASPCRCHKHVQTSIAAGTLDPHHLSYATTQDGSSQQQLLMAQQQELDTVCRTAALLRAHPAYTPSVSLVATLQDWLTNPTSQLLENTMVTG